MAVALDSNAVIGFLDSGDAFHQAVDERIRRLLGEGENLYASVMTCAEVLSGAKLGHHGEAAVKGFFTDLITWVGSLASSRSETRSDAVGIRWAAAGRALPPT
jgi:predicted nucleic acid-binding protein